MSARAGLALRRLVRRPEWVVANLALGSVGMAFVMIWGPTNGLPIDHASLFAETAFVGRLGTAVLATWLAAHAVAGDDRVATARWAVVSGAPGSHIMRDQMMAAVAATATMSSMLWPALWIAGRITGEPPFAMAIAALLAAAFAACAAAVTAAAAAWVPTPVACWSVAMCVMLGLALALRTVPSTAGEPWRIGVTVAAGLAAAWIAVMNPREGRAQR